MSASITSTRWVCVAAALVASLAPVTRTGGQQVKDWPIHSMERPRPRVVRPAPPADPLPAPSDAVVLFDGRSLDAWQATDTAQAVRPARWKVEDGYVEVVPGSGEMHTRRGFGDVQLHIEWRTPVPPHGTGQERGNSGVFLMGRYEVQVLDSYENETYADGQAAAVYGQHPPLVNVTRPPGEWQTYDIVFHRPRFAPDGKLQQPARVTVLHNGVLVQDNVELTGPTAHQARPPYVSHPDRLPLALQDHGNRVRYRNIWLRELEGT